MRLKPGELGVNIYGGESMPADCANCPFKRAEEGNPYLYLERYEDIMFAVTLGQPFFCHKTVYNDRRTSFQEDPESGMREAPNFAMHYRMCHGAKRWAQQIAEGKDPIAEFVKGNDP